MNALNAATYLSGLHTYYYRNGCHLNSQNLDLSGGEILNHSVEFLNTSNQSIAKRFSVTLAWLVEIVLFTSSCDNMQGG